MHLNVCACVVCFCCVPLPFPLCVCVSLKISKTYMPTLFTRFSSSFFEIPHTGKQRMRLHARIHAICGECTHTHIYRGIAHDLLNQTHIIKQLAMCLFGHAVNIVTYLTRLWWILLCPTKPWSHVTITVLRRKVRDYKSAHRVTGHRLSQ